MNFVFVSPNFPSSYWNFCDRLRSRGATVLGIGDTPYDSLDGRLRAALTEYYKVGSLEDYGAVSEAVRHFEGRYGHVDWLESNNEYWLGQDARLRSDFGITSGVGAEGIEAFRSKARMKEFYALGGIPTARQHRVTDRPAAEEFISLVGYPVIVKPEIGVGAAATWKLSTPEDLERFFASRPEVPYVMEEFITGDIYSYDAILDSRGEPLFESSAHFPPSVMDIVNENLDMVYYVLPDVPAQLRRRGRATAKAFGVRSRFVHFEFFRLSSGKKGLGRKGDFVGLEVNMRPAGGYTPDMMNWAHCTDVYSIWADMVTADKAAPSYGEGEDHYCLYYGRRDARSYAHSHDEIWARYGANMAMNERIPAALAPDMGDVCYTLHAYGQEQLEEMISFLGAR